MVFQLTDLKTVVFFLVKYRKSGVKYCKFTRLLVNPFHQYLLPPVYKPIKRYSQPWKSLNNSGLAEQNKF